MKLIGIKPFIFLTKLLNMDVFISNEFSDIKYRNQVKSIIENPNTNIPHKSIHEARDERNKGKRRVNKYISNLIRGTGAMLCLIGENTYNAPGVRNEINTANNWGIPVIPVRIHKTNGGLPKEIKIKRTIPLNPTSILDALNHKNQWI